VNVLFRGLVLGTCIALAACGGGASSNDNGSSPSTGSPQPVELKVLANNLEGENVVADTDAVIAINLNQEIASDADLVQSGELVGPHGVVALESASVSGLRITFKPAQNLALKSDYVFTLKHGVLAKSGAILTADYTFAFKTLPIKFSSQLIIPAEDGFRGAAKPLIAVGDLNGDGRSDIVLLGRLLDPPEPASQGYSLILSLQDGAGRFSRAQRIDMLLPGISSLVYDDSVFVLDMDGDGLPEIIVSERRYEDSQTGLRVFKRGADGKYSNAFFYQTKYVRALTLADLDHDGRPELVGGYVDNYSAGFQLLKLAQGFEPMAVVSLAPSMMEFTVGDIDGDGTVDVMVRQPYSISNISTLPATNVYTPSSDGALKVNELLTAHVAATCENTVSCQQAQLIDVNGDGLLDLVYGSRSGSDGPQAAIFIQQVDGEFSTGPRTSYGLGGNVLFVHDLDHDGYQDLLIINNTTLGVGIGQGQSSFQYSPAFSIPVFDSIYEGSAVLADINGDGFLDAVVVSENSGTAVMFQTRQ